MEKEDVIRFIQDFCLNEYLRYYLLIEEKKET